MKNVLVLTVSGIILACALSVTAFAASEANRISIRYVPPKNPIHQEIYLDLKQRSALKKLQEFLSPILLPEKLQISVTECDGEADAFYEDAAITICYEYINELWENMPKETTPGGVEPIDTVIGPLVEASLHEVGHALFDMLELPVFGREEDAADQVAAYVMLQFADVVSEGHLPMARAEFCEEEYEQVQDAFEILVKPHLDPVLAEKVRNNSWLRE